jgi:hypothetical protein
VVPWFGEKSRRNLGKYFLTLKFYFPRTVDMDDFTGTTCGNNVKYPLIGAMREELRGVSRGKDAKDVDWEKVAASFDDLPV